MGTPDFAVEPLKSLISGGFNVVAVVTVADKPAGRGLKLHESPVKQFVIQHNLNVADKKVTAYQQPDEKTKPTSAVVEQSQGIIKILQPVKLSEPDFINELRELNADLFIVVAFRKLPQVVWQMAPLGCCNLHASLLPQYRGAAPINHAVINGETITGVTTFFIDEQIDTGNIILQKQVPIGPDETAGEVHDKLMETGAGLVVETVKAIQEGGYVAKSQSAEGSLTQHKVAPKIFRDDCRIDWHKPAFEVHNKIRGLSPFPGAFSVLVSNESEKEVKIHRTHKTALKSDLLPGEIMQEKNKLFVMCHDEMLEIISLQLPGKKMMQTEEFLRGNRTVLIKFK